MYVLNIFNYPGYLINVMDYKSNSILYVKII